jgi:hypothetical protein
MVVIVTLKKHFSKVEGVLKANVLKINRLSYKVGNEKNDNILTSDMKVLGIFSMQ